MKAVLLLLLSAGLACGHRLDEYLQATIFTLAKDHVEAEMTLTPGVAVFPVLVRDIDVDGNGVISAEEQGEYARQVLRDISLRMDGTRLVPKVKSMAFPAVGDMREGRGEIVIAFTVELPRGGMARKLMFENRHHRQIAAYQVNVLVPADPGLKIVEQKRSYDQASYELDVEQKGADFRLSDLVTFASILILCFGLVGVRYYRMRLVPLVQSLK